MAFNIFKILRSVTAGNRPSGGAAAFGIPYVNFADNQFGVCDASNAPRDLIGVPFFSANASYAAGIPVINGGFLYVAKQAITPGAFNSAQWARLLQTNGGQTITGGFALTPFNLPASTSFTLNPLNGNYQWINNGGAFTITNPAVDCAVDILVINIAGAGAITFTGYNVGANIGDALTTTSGNRFIISSRTIAGLSTYSIKALQ
jgi:hypothetical protein